MTKVTIEIDLPEGQPMPDPAHILRLTDPNWMASWWHTSDIQYNFEDDNITEDEARAILELASDYHDCNVGLSWDSFDVWKDMVLRDRPEGYCFLSQDDKEEYPYGIEYSSDIDGNEIDDVEWFATEELRAAEISKCKNMNFAFPREEV